MHMKNTANIKCWSNKLKQSKQMEYHMLMYTHWRNFFY